jgi:eukaryotic-like serine/threonine-protein kinase
MLDKRFGSYRLVRLIGAGSMGAVYLAAHETLGYEVAVKVIRSDCLADPVQDLRFCHEAKVIAGLLHPGIVRMLDFARRSDGRAYMVMELLEGRSLAQALQDGPLDEARAINITHQVALAMAAAHDHQIVHRDLKPGNIFLVSEPEAPLGERAKVLDFGIAKRSMHTGQFPIGGDEVIGTPAYMSPEQCLPGRMMDCRSDIYGLGATLYHMVTGAPPFGRQSATRLLAHHQHTVPPPAAERRPGLSPTLSMLIDRCLAKQPGRRFETMWALAEQLQALSRAAPARSGARVDKAITPGPESMARGSFTQRSTVIPLRVRAVDGMTLRVRPTPTSAAGRETYASVDGVAYAATAARPIAGARTAAPPIAAYAATGAQGVARHTPGTSFDRRLPPALVPLATTAGELVVCRPTPRPAFRLAWRWAAVTLSVFAVSLIGRACAQPTPPAVIARTAPDPGALAARRAAPVTVVTEPMVPVTPAPTLPVTPAPTLPVAPAPTLPESTTPATDSTTPTMPESTTPATDSTTPTVPESTTPATDSTVSARPSRARAAKGASHRSRTHKPGRTASREPVESASREPVESPRREPVESPRREPVEAARRESVEAARREPVGSARRESGEAARRESGEAAEPEPEEAAEPAPEEAARRESGEAAEPAPEEAAEPAPRRAAKRVESTIAGLHVRTQCGRLREVLGIAGVRDCVCNLARERLEPSLTARSRIRCTKLTVLLHDKVAEATEATDAAGD